MKILVTGATGFIGRELCQTLRGAGLSVRAALRKEASAIETDEQVVVGEISPDTDWSAALDGIDAIVHLAARVHVMHDRSSDPLQEFRRINASSTEHLARSAARNGVRRMVFVSSIKVNGECSPSGAAFSESDVPNPSDPYGVSKWEAEQALQAVTAETGLETVILRPPLVYGPGVKANFLNLMKIIARGVPLPLGAIENRRSLIYVKNLTDALRQCVDHPRAANQVFLVSDGEDLSTAELIRRLALKQNSPILLIPVPETALRFAAKLLRHTAAMDRLAGSLTVEIFKIRNLLAWTPPHSVDQGLTETVAWFSGEYCR